MTARAPVMSGGIGSGHVDALAFPCHFFALSCQNWAGRGEPGLRNATIVGIVKDGLGHLKKDEAIVSVAPAAKPLPPEKK